MREYAPASAQAERNAGASLRTSHACQADESDNLKPEELKIDTVIANVKNKK